MQEQQTKLQALEKSQDLMRKRDYAEKVKAFQNLEELKTQNQVMYNLQRTQNHPKNPSFSIQNSNPQNSSYQENFRQ